MGSKSSKVAAAGATRRQYPSRIPSTTPSAAQPSPTTAPPPPPSTSASPSATSPPPATPHPQSDRFSRPAPLASTTKSTHITHDSADPHFASQLRSLGPVKNPASTLSRTSTVAMSPQYPSAASPEGGSGLPARAGAEGGPVPTQRDGGAQVFPDPRNNTALRVLRARERVSREAELEVEAAGAAAAAGRKGPGGASAEGRRYMDAITLRRILWLRDKGGVAGAEIERRLGLRGGVVAMLRGTALPDEAKVTMGPGLVGMEKENEGPSRFDAGAEAGRK